MVELRVPQNILGSALVMIMTLGVLASSLASFASYSPQPIPYLSGFTMICLCFIASFMLPPPIVKKGRDFIVKHSAAIRSLSQLDFTR